MSLLARYVARTVIANVLLALSALLVVFTVVNLAQELEDVGVGRYSLGDAFGFGGAGSAFTSPFAFDSGSAAFFGSGSAATGFASSGRYFTAAAGNDPRNSSLKKQRNARENRDMWCVG